MKSAAYLRAVVNAVNLTRAHDDLISQYEEKVSENAEWADERTTAAEARSHGGSTDEVKAKLDDFYTYKGSDKVAKNADLQHTENILLALRTSQANGGRPTYEAPSDELEMDALKARFEALDESEDKCVGVLFFCPTTPRRVSPPSSSGRAPRARCAASAPSSPRRPPLRRPLGSADSRASPLSPLFLFHFSFSPLSPV
jgi:hypothetical protein